MSAASSAALDAGRAAARQQSWKEAHEQLQNADRLSDLSPDDLELLATAAWSVGEYDVVLRAHERAYSRYLAAGRKMEAGLVAMTLALEYYLRGEMTLGSGWHATAERLTHDEPESRVHGLIAWGYAQVALLLHSDLDGAALLGRRTTEIGDRLGDMDLQMLGLGAEARVMIRQGRVEEGTTLLDETMALAITGQTDAWTSQFTYCSTLCACEELADYRRAGEWTQAAERAYARQEAPATSGHCRVHRATFLRSTGDWDKAEEEARLGCAEIHGLQLHIGQAQYDMGEIRLLRGDLSEAEELFRQAHEAGRSPQPGMALLRLSQGRTDAALTSIAHALQDESLDRLPRSNLLFAQVEIALSVGNLATARAAADELAGIAQAFHIPALEAAAAYAEGSVQLAAGDNAGALASLRRSNRLWQEIGVPYEVARTRLPMAKLYLLQGDSDAAEMELGSAHSTFLRLGAVPALRAVDALQVSMRAGAGADSTADTHATRTFMFTDIVKSTSLLDAIGDEAWVNVLNWHDETLRALFAQYDGEEVHYTGDGFFIAFKDGTRAIACAVAIQRTLAENRRKHGFSPQVRIGLHASAATRGTLSYHGKGVHMAARIGAEAHGGEVLASQSTIALVPAQLTTTEPRILTLRGISEPVTVAAILWQ